MHREEWQVNLIFTPRVGDQKALTAEELQSAAEASRIETPGVRVWIAEEPGRRQNYLEYLARSRAFSTFLRTNFSTQAIKRSFGGGGMGRGHSLKVPLWVVAVAAIVIGAILAFQRGPTISRRVFSIIVGELKEDYETAGFVLFGGNITSPGPTIRVRKGDQVTITFKNVHGTFSLEYIPHNFVVVAEKKESAEPLWGAKIGETTYPDFYPSRRKAAR